MPKKKLAVTLDRPLVAERHFTSRSQAIQSAVSYELEPLHRRRLAREWGRLDAEGLDFVNEGLNRIVGRP